MISRVVDRRFAFGPEVNDEFHAFMLGVSREYRTLLMAGAFGRSADLVSRDGKLITKTLRKGISKEEPERKDGDRAIKGSGSDAKGVQLSLRDLRLGI